MITDLTLHGYHYSVYTRIARIVLELKSVPYQTQEMDPFDPADAAHVGELHPFGRVPVLQQGRFVLYETGAITRYIDAAFEGPSLIPDTPRARGRMDQVISLVDNYVYWPLVRQVAVERVFQPKEGIAPDLDILKKGLAASEKALTALEDIAAEGLVLNGDITLADCHLIPMMDYFVKAPEGAEMLHRFRALDRWWHSAAAWPSVIKTDPLAAPL